MISAAYLENLAAQIRSVDDCAQLQSLATASITALNSQIASVEAQIAALAPFLALATAPTDLPSVLSWIPNFITAFIGPQVAAGVAFVADLTALATAAADVVSALEAAEARITHCTITIPPVHP